jgi:hypothetical protein
VFKHKISAGVYELSQSAYRSRWFCVLKKSGKLRIVHDLQPLNAITIRDAGLPPIVDDFIEPFAGRQCYTVFDLFWGFDARKVHPSSRDLTAFLTPLGLLRLTSLPTGFTNSPAEFQRCMLFILQDEIPDVAHIFIDDLPIKGPASAYLDANGTPEVHPENSGIRRFIWEHAVDVHRIMHRVKHSGATFSPSKTQICRPEVLIVGQRCTPEGRIPDEEKVKKILNWPILTTPQEARMFMGLCGTVRIWIKNYSLYARPITEHWRNNEEFIWDERRQAAFDFLKEQVTSAPALRPIDYSSPNPIILAVDTSFMAVGFILYQIDNQGKRRPSRYGSIPLDEIQSRYSQPKLELYGLFRALRKWRLYIIGAKTFHVEVDAKYIKGMLNDPDLQPNAAINRWIQGILMFDFTLIHVPAIHHKAADALSRCAIGEGEEIVPDDDSWLDDVALYTGISQANYQSNYLETIPQHNALHTLPSTYAINSHLDQTLRAIFKFLTTLEAPEFDSIQGRKRFIKKATQFFVRNGHMYKRQRNGAPLRVIMEEKRRRAILVETHEKMGHRQEQATWETIRTRFYWPHLRADVHHHVQSCHPCQIRSIKKVEIPLTISTPATLFTKVYVDVMFMPQGKNKKKYIVAARDDLSRAAEGRALATNNAEAIMQFFWEQIYCRYGAVGQIITDNGSEFKGAFKLLHERMKVPQILISTYNSKANGVVERGHFNIRESILKACGDNVYQWPDKVAPAFFADRVTVSQTTGWSPYYILHGVHPVLPLDLFEHTFLVTGFKDGLSSSDLLALRTRQLEKREEDLSAAAKRLEESRFRSKEQFERRYRKRLTRDVYMKGDLVLVRNNTIETWHNRKYFPRYLGPFVVDRRTKGGSYVLRELDGTLWRKGTAAFRLLPFIDRDDPIIQELADLEDEEPEDSGEPLRIKERGRKEIDQEAPESSDSDTDSDIDSAAHVSTDAESDASEEVD